MLLITLKKCGYKCSRGNFQRNGVGGTLNEVKSKEDWVFTKYNNLLGIDEFLQNTVELIP